MIKQIFHVAAAFILVAVMAGAAQANPYKAQETDVKSCNYLSQVYGFSGYGKNSGWLALARDSAEKKADSIGVTHIVFNGSQPVGGFNGEVSGKAYRCQS